MDGIIVLNKPVGLTSARALDRVRRLTGIRKSGHAGTLDPLADGVLLICQGRATKLVEALMDLPKTYRARGRLDVTSDSLDSETELRPVPVDRVPTREELDAVVSGFSGEIQQIPPAISAIKIGGQPAYKRARRGERVDLPPRPVRVYEIGISRYEWPELDFEVQCGRGTYVRALIRDIGAGLGVGGTLTALTRTAVGPFCLEDALGFDELAARPDASEFVIPIDTARELAKEKPTRTPPGSSAEV
ncbi:MAG: tRNA pseudouridine(55) synthase TruB [Phycisphaerales bacterium]|nr:tRNA pseudouridine(55) synthase TruB [Phycisphaerales bacterium]